MMSSSTASSGKKSTPPSSISHREEIINNLLLLRKNDSLNDVKIILSDGIVFANSVIMSSASDYFATMLSSDKFVEGETKEVPMEEYGTKEAMERVVLYLHSGDMNVTEIRFETLLEIMNLSKMLLLRTDSLFTSLEAHIISLLSGRRPRPNISPSMLEVLRGFMLVERYRLDGLRKCVVNDIYAAICYVHLLDGEAGATLQQMNIKMIKEILLYKYDRADPGVKMWRRPATMGRLQYFQVWYSKNKDCKDEEKKSILDSIDLDEFTGEDLLTVVKDSGLFPEEDIIKKCIEKFRKSDQ